MKTNRMLLVLALSFALAAPVAAQSMPAPAPAPAVDPMQPMEPTPADPAAVPTDPMAVPADPAVSPMDPMAAPAPEPTPALEPAPAAAPAPAPAPAPISPSELPVETGEEHEDEDGPKCALKDLCLGPMFSLGVLNVVGFGAAARYGDHVGFAIDYQFMPSLGFGDVSASWSLFTLEGRWHVGGSAFWLGGGFGLQSFSAEGKVGTGVDEMRVEGSVTIPALKLGLGVMGRDGFVMGIDLGFNIPLGGTDVGFSGADPDVYPEALQAQNDIKDAAEKGINLIPVIPQFNVLRIGYLF